MKFYRRILLFLFAVSLVLSLTACSDDSVSEPRTAVIEADNQTLIVTFDEGTRSSGTIQAENGDTYTFSYESRGSSSTEFTLVYPDGFVYRHTDSGGIVAGSGSYEQREEGYVDGFSMSWALERVADNRLEKTKQNGGSPFLALLLIALGVWQLVKPETVWYLAYGWHYKDAEPSDLSISIYRFGGGIMIFVGIILLISALF